MTERTIPAGQFKAKCLQLLDDVAATGVEVIVTKRGKPVAKVVPLQSAEALRETLRGSITFHCTDEELIAPIDVEWDALR